MVEGVSPAFRRLDEDAEILPRSALADEFVERLGAQSSVYILGPALWRCESVGVGHRAAFLSAARTRVSRLGAAPSSASALPTADEASAGRKPRFRRAETASAAALPGTGGCGKAAGPAATPPPPSRSSLPM